MEGIEEPALQEASEESVKDSASDDITISVQALSETDVCHTSNGVAESEAVNLKNEQDTAPIDETTIVDETAESTAKIEVHYEQYEDVAESTEIYQELASNPEHGNEVGESEASAETHGPEYTEVEITDGNNTTLEPEVIEESVVEDDGFVENNAGNITFETEIFIENNTAELEEMYEEPDSSNILSELGQNIELSDALRSTDACDAVENNNCEQEVFNKEELLDILEGNGTEQSRKAISENFKADCKKLEEQLAMQQLNRLKHSDSRKRTRNSPKKLDKKLPKRNSSQYASKEKEEVTTSSQQAPKDPVEDTTTPLNTTQETRGKAITAKETKAKVSTTTSSTNASNETNKTVDDTNITQTPTKEAKKQVTETSTPQNTSKGVKRKVHELNNVQNASKDEKEKETLSLQSVANEAKGKHDDKNSNKSIKENSKVAKSKAKVETKPKKDIVTTLVQDWSDDEPNETETNSHNNETKDLLENTEELVITQIIVAQEQDKPNETQGDEQTSNSVESSVSDELSTNIKSGDESQPQRRLGRVIKKKVIYDPDNPDTFTKTAKHHVKKEKEALPLPEKDITQATPKKVKTDESPQVAKSKSPVSKMQWKKPQPRNSKQSTKRLTEIDKLLMDEGAVNMICQLTPEALKGNKNMKTRAEFIKNIQSNTPDSKEMKFRERKSKIKAEEGESKKLGSSKQRLSLSSSVKSPAASDDFENHSADDSIIYRRHSSSSYSSSCMSPRRLSDVEGGSSNQSAIVTQIVIQESKVDKKDCTIFMAEKTSTPRRDIMNKSDCLSIKQKLNSKLSQALNKRKLSSFQSGKPSKVKKVVQVEEVSTDVTLNFNKKVAEICIRKAGSLFNVQIMRVLENILWMVDSNKETTVTLLTSERGNLCSGLDLKPILGNEKHACDIADHARSLMHALESHSKLVLIGVEGKVQGFGLALAALSDVLIATENTSFSLAQRSNAVLHPGAGVLNTRALSQELISDLVVFGRELSSSDALRGGLVNRVLWPERFQEQVRAIATDVSTQPLENVTLKKQLLNLKKAGSASTFESSLDKERDLFVNYWTSNGVMDLLRASNDAA